MSKKVLIISASPRKGGNSDVLCDQFLLGAKEAGHEVEKVFLRDKKIKEEINSEKQKENDILEKNKKFSDFLEKGKKILTDNITYYEKLPEYSNKKLKIAKISPLDLINLTLRISKQNKSPPEGMLYFEKYLPDISMISIERSLNKLLVDQKIIKINSGKNTKYIINKDK